MVYHQEIRHNCSLGVSCTSGDWKINLVPSFHFSDVGCYIQSDVVIDQMPILEADRSDVILDLMPIREAGPENRSREVAPKGSSREVVELTR
jgi:hypothetical protein